MTKEEITICKMYLEEMGKDKDCNEYKLLMQMLEQQSIAEERYQDLVEYFSDKDVAKCILEDREEFKKWLECIKWHVRKADELARKLEQLTSDDCVSREKVWYMITGGKYANEDYEQFIDRLVKELENMPPVTPTYHKSATNGEEIIRAFPNLKYTIQNGRVVTTIGVASSFDLKWWNAPYEKRGSENG